MYRYFRKLRPGRVACRCGWSGSSNALAKAAHLRGKDHEAWEYTQHCRGRAGCCLPGCPHVQANTCPFEWVPWKRTDGCTR